MSRFTRACLVLAAVSLTIAACSDDDNSSPTTLFVPPITPSTTDVPTTTVAETDAPTTTAVPVTTTTTALAENATTRTYFAAQLDSAIGMAWRPNDATIYVVEQGGRVVAVRDDGAEQPVVLDITGQVTHGNEQGLLGLAFHPNQPYAYVNYTDGNGDTVVSEFAIAEDGTFDPGTERVVLTVDQPYPNHNGGHITFGPDGHLYIGLGDGGSGGDPERHALDLGSLLGKLLRVDPRPVGDAPYSVPGDNPFITTTGARSEIWSYGLRNPWRFEFDPETSDLWIADVGQNEWEEISVSAVADGAGSAVNFGWSAFEGTHQYNTDQPTDGAVAPVFEYSHSATNGCSITGGNVYRGTAIPSLHGWYVFTDYCDATLYAFRLSDGAVVRLSQGDGNISAIRTGPDGELYAADAANGLFRIDPA